MADQPADIEKPFKGLPMADLIGGPLVAAIDAQLAAAKATVAFIETVGGQPPINVSVERPSLDDAQGSETVSIAVPALAVVKTPALSIDTVDFNFDMEVTSATVSPEGGDNPGAVRLEGVVAQRGQDARASGAKYHVAIRAVDKGVPDGLARVLDILNSAITARAKPGG